MRSSPLASTSVRRHLARGLLGLIALAGAIVGTALGVAAALGLLVVAAVAWRGCPTCWAVGLMQTRRGEACACGAAPRRSCGSSL